MPAELDSSPPETAHHIKKGTALLSKGKRSKGKPGGKPGGNLGETWGQTERFGDFFPHQPTPLAEWHAPRVVAAGFPHHLTQRGNRRQDIFDNDSLRLVYLHLLRDLAQLYSLRVLGFCLMTNHVHLVAVPEFNHSMAKTMKYVHGQFAQFWNALAGTTGHLWQNRFYSCPMEWPAVDRVIRYVELNPVRAGLVREAPAYRWSSARAHHGEPDEFALLDRDGWQERWTARAWAEFLGQPAESDCLAIRRSTHTGRPLGSPGYVQDLECRLGRLLHPKPGGRPPKARTTRAAT